MGEKARAFEGSLHPARIRAAIRDEVASILPLDELEETHRSDALAWIDSGAPLCRTAKPATPPKHLVSYIAVVDGHDILLEVKTSNLTGRNSRGLSGLVIRMCRLIGAIRSWSDFWQNSVRPNSRALIIQGLDFREVLTQNTVVGAHGR
jgi:hypothetical protein